MTINARGAQAAIARWNANGAGLLSVQEVQALSAVDALMPPQHVAALALAPKSADDLRLPPPASSRTSISAALARFEHAFRERAEQPAIDGDRADRELRLIAVVSGVARLQARIRREATSAQRG